MKFRVLDFKHSAILGTVNSDGSYGQDALSTYLKKGDVFIIIGRDNYGDAIIYSLRHNGIYGTYIGPKSFRNNSYPI